MKALITGASSKIGKAIAKELSLRGYDLILVARNIQKLKELQTQINTHIEVVCMDISKEENCYQLYKEYKDINVLINDAGLRDCGYFYQTSLEKDIQMIHTNIIGLHVLTKLYLQDMKEKDHGTILNVASIGGFMPGPLMATYYA
ncbi:SDR family NAD(P)-dependent oxidoreductase [Massilimicrobiota timonensis]|uniref:SDR family NAD(P)-dependent oxidoreductase n=1 Tax=Massilimicrobiota timonensis TaxID=1776392 RepID=A0ABT7UEZ1_9FIRM|nr:SDR family NAD(P)-dependent oxidoreductase [Massilimicrobiota timonensis]MDM8194719.1 SDR family NAD(P)-dependent oxidoreductase [Massilimicrobiota timonensis]